MPEPVGPETEFNRAVALHQAGRLEEAATIYGRILASRPGHFGANHLLGVIFSQRGAFAQAVTLIEKALAIDDREAAAHVNLGNALMGAGRAGDAADAYREALARMPELPEALFGLGNALRASNPKEAADAYHRAIAARPNFVEALANLAALELSQGQTMAALGHWREAAKHRPAAIDLHLGAARALLALDRGDEAMRVYRRLADDKSATPDALFEAANGLARARRFEDAATLYHAVLKREPGLMPALNNLGNMLRELGRLDEAEATYRNALDADPRNAAVMSNHALILKDMDRVSEAEAEARRSLSVAPTAVGHNNLGLILNYQGRVDEALGQFQRAVAMAPDMPDLVFHEAIALLHLGRFAEGWPKYEARWSRQRALERPRDFARPQWKGESPSGRTILLHSEQGFGDTLMFARYAPLLAERGARVILECQPALTRLMKSVAGIDMVIPRGAPLPPFDLHCPLMSLPLAFATTLDTIPAKTPYLQPPIDAVAQWSDELGGSLAKQVGLVWAGDARHYDLECTLTDRRRSVSLDAYRPLMAVSGIRFLSLQMGPASAQAHEHHNLLDLTSKIRDFADTAGLIAHLDLVISVDTAVAHLAAAMDKPVWVLSRHDNCWRWMAERDDSPWYPSLHLHRQAKSGDWPAVIARIADDLADWAGGAGARRQGANR